MSILTVFVKGSYTALFSPAPPGANSLPSVIITFTSLPITPASLNLEICLFIFLLALLRLKSYLRALINLHEKLKPF